MKAHEKLKFFIILKKFKSYLTPGNNHLVSQRKRDFQHPTVSISRGKSRPSENENENKPTRHFYPNLMSTIFHLTNTKKLISPVTPFSLLFLCTVVKNNPYQVCKMASLTGYLSFTRGRAMQTYFSA